MNWVLAIGLFFVALFTGLIPQDFLQTTLADFGIVLAAVPLFAIRYNRTFAMGDDDDVECDDDDDDDDDEG